jgi:hypothetical protein
MKSPPADVMFIPMASAPIRAELLLALVEARRDGRAQWAVAADAGIHPSTLSRIVFRRREYADNPPSHERAKAIARSLGCDVGELFPDLVGEKSSQPQ